jgi:apolipoprotein N-acyltransferase
MVGEATSPDWPAAVPDRQHAGAMAADRPRRLAPDGWGRGLLAGLAGGALVALSIPPFGWYPLAWIGLAVVAAALPGRPRRTRLAVGAGFGVADYAIGLAWVQEFSVYGYVALVVVSGLYALLAVVLVPAGRRGTVAVGLPAALVAADWARDRFPLGGLPLGGLALGQAAGPLVPVARLGGSLALVGVTALAGVALASLARLVWSLRPAGRRGSRVGDAPAAASGVAARLVAVPLAATTLVVVLPLAALATPSGAGDPAAGTPRAIRVGLVQGGGPRGTRAVNTDPQVVFDRHLEASRRLTGPLDLIVWPEGVLQSHAPFGETVDAAELAALAQSHDATVVAGVEQDVGRTRYLNEVVAWAPTGAVVSTYVKNHLVPFGEYVPYRSLVEKLFNIADVPLDAIPGHSPGFLPTPAAPLAVMISFEVFFDERARGGVRAGGRVLVVPTNTASYRSTQVPTQEVAADRLRAWETGRWLVQVTPVGYATVVSPSGRVVDRSHLDAQTVVEATVPLRSGLTVYDHLGDTPVLLGAVVAWLAAAGPAIRTRAGTGRGARSRVRRWASRLTRRSR